MDSKGTTVPADATPEERQEYEQYVADYKDYTKYVTDGTRELGNALRANPDDDNAYNAYRDAVKTYYTVQGGAKGDLIPDENTVKNLVEGGKQFFGAQWESAKKAASGVNPLQALYGQQAGAAAAISDLGVMALQGVSWLGEKALAEAGQYETAAERAAGRLRDTARYEAGVQKYLRPESEQGQGVFDISRTATGFALPVGGIAKGAKTAGVAAEAAETAAKAGRFAAMSEKAGGFAGRVVGRAGGPLGKAVGEEIGSGLGRAVGTTIEPVVDVTAGTAKGALTGGTVGGVLGAGTVGAQEPVGTPLSRGVAPGVIMGGGAGAFLGGKAAIAERNAPRPADAFRDFDGGGAVRVDQNRWAMETGLGVGEQAQKFSGPTRETLHRDTLGSYQNMQANPRYGADDSVMRFGYDPETRTMQVVMSESTKGDYVPRDRYVYQNVPPELAQRIIDSPSIQAELNAIAGEGGYGVRMSRPVITDAQLNSLINDLNTGKLDFHPEWGFSKGSGTPPEFQFRVPEISKTEPTTASSGDIGSKEWNPAFFEFVGKKAGEAYKGVREAFGTMEEGERTPAASERVSDADIARFRRESRTRGTPVEEPQKALGAAPERRALAAAAPLPEPQPVLGTTEVRRPMLQEPTERVQRREDVEAAFAEEDARLAREEQIRQSPLGAEALRGTLKKRAQDAERRQRYKEEGRVPLASYRKKAGVEFPPSEEALRQANVEATPAPVTKEPDAPFEASATVPPGKTARDAKRMSQRMREIDAELMGTSGPKTRVKLLEERLELAAELGNEKAAEALSKWQQPNVEAEFYSDVRKLVNESGITNDPKYKNAGEVNLLRESGINFKSFKKGGKTLDELGETIAEKAVEYGLMLGDQATWDINSTTRFIADAFAAPRTAEPPVVGQPPIEGRAVKPKQSAPKKAKAESEEVTSVKDLRAQKKKAAIAEELAGKFAEPAPKGGKKVTLEQPAEKPAPAKTSTPPSKPTTKSYEDEIYRISQVVPPGPVSPKVVGMIADGVVKKGLLTADEVSGVRKISDLNKLLQDKIDAKKETGSKQYWSAESLNLESMKTSPSERSGAAPYTLIVDGKTKRYWSLPALDKVLKSISSEKPRIFKNADKGITINFDS
jgi:chorismate mutase